MVGRQYGIQGTPAWLVAQRLITGLRSATEFERLAEYAMQDRSAGKPQGKSNLTVGEGVRERRSPVLMLQVHKLKKAMETERVGGKTMKRVMRTGVLGLVLTAAALGVSPGLAQNVEQVKAVFEHVIPNTEGRSMVVVVVTYPPGGKSSAHHHAGSAFIYAHVLSGAIRSQVGDEPAKVYQVGEGFYEVPGSHHKISENASDRDPASLLAVFVVDSKDTPLTIPDQK
jgi:quercetin dioxygenase-like cupin family protein